MRLIDTDKLKDIISDTWILDRIDEQPTINVEKVIAAHEQIGYDKGWQDGYAQAIINASTIDSMGVVQCKNCTALQYCRFAQGLGLDGFCSMGERRRNEID